MRGLDGKVAIVTGGSRGMGEQAARRLVAEGSRVVIGDILADEGKALADELGESVRFIRHDVSDEDSWREMVDFAQREFGQIDILINNAGILSFGLLRDMELDEYMRLVKVNQVGVMLGMKHVIPPMTEAGGGAIVNVSSVEGLGGAPALSHYVATKFAVRGMTKAAAWELGRKGIRVNSVHPGAIKTPMVMNQPGMNDETREASEQFIASKTALRRMGEPDEVANVMVFLASDDASYMTGAEVAVDGGVAASSGFAV